MIGRISSGMGSKAYVSSATPVFKGISDPKTSAEQLQKLLRDYYHNAKADGERGSAYGKYAAIQARFEIAKIIRDQGGDKKCSEFWSELQYPVDDTLPDNY